MFISKWELKELKSDIRSLQRLAKMQGEDDDSLRRRITKLEESKSRVPRKYKIFVSDEIQHEVIADEVRWWGDQLFLKLRGSEVAFFLSAQAYIVAELDES